ncbi:MAG: hypothetical protein ACHQ52_08315 [Candidatus Eisenbacteria bacterium]
MRRPAWRVVPLAVAWALAIPFTRVHAGCAPPDRAIIGEVFYDAIGDDTGLEFVELYDPRDTPVALAGVRLEAGDGAGPGRWTLRWTGAPGDTVRPHRRFVIGGAGVIPAPDARVTLDLQNGPDAVRLVWPDGVTEVVGYGALAEPEYFCGTPAADVPSGMSLARVPDDADLGANGLDFRAAAPTPGRANQPALDLALARGSLTLAPPHPRVGEPAILTGRVAARGTAAIAVGSARVRGGWRSDADTAWTSDTALPALPSGDSAGFTLALGRLPLGRRVLLARIVLAGDEDPDDDTDSLRVWVGVAPLTLSEVQFHPADDAGEWVEVTAWDTGPVSAAGFTLGDHSGTVATAHGGRALGPGERAVLAQHRDAFLAAHPGLDSSRVLEATPWPSLNNSDAADGIADVLTLADPDGTPCDRLAYSAAGVPAGVPIERLDDTHWAPARDPGGTPLAPPLPPPAFIRRFEAHPARLPAGITRARLAWSLPWDWSTVSVRAFDLAGRNAGIVLPAALRSGHAESDWDPSTLPAGVYLLVLTAGPGTSGAALTATTAVRIVRRVP